MMKSYFMAILFKIIQTKKKLCKKSTNIVSEFPQYNMSYYKQIFTKCNKILIRDNLKIVGQFIIRLKSELSLERHNKEFNFNKIINIELKSNLNLAK